MPDASPRDRDRRTYRRRTIKLAFFSVVSLGLIRWSIDQLLSHPFLSHYGWLNSYVIYLMILFYVVVQAIGIHLIFRRYD